MTETTFLVEWTELKKSEADLIIFTLGTGLVAPTQKLLEKFSEHMRELFEENDIDIPFTVVAKALVEVEAIVKKKDEDEDDED